MDEPEGVTIKQVAECLGVTVARIRQRFDAEGGAERARANKEDVVLSQGQGRRATVYRLDFMKSLFGDFQRTEASTSRLPPPVAELLARSSGKSDIHAIIESRTADAKTFEDVLLWMIGKGTDLRIRSIAATFVSRKTKWDPIYQAFEVRAREKRSIPKLLLLHPLASAARLRSNVEEGESRKPTRVSGELSAKALSAFKQTTMWDDFVAAWQFVTKEKTFELEARWVDVSPQSMLIYCDECALLETYDFGRASDAVDRECIGRLSPVIVVKPGRYLKSLKSGFDRIFAPDPGWGVGTFTADEVSPQEIEAVGEHRRPRDSGRQQTRQTRAHGRQRGRR
jgi:hypothetical protein